MLFEQDQTSPTDEEKLSSLGVSISEKKEDAKKARKESGIEEIWKACEEAYLGIDASNRHEFEKAKWAKPTSMDGPVTTSNGGGDDESQSTAFVRLTSRYVDAGTAKLAEILLPIDDKPFSFEPSPVPELVQAKEVLRSELDRIMKGGEQPAPPVQQNSMVQAMQGAVPGQPAQTPGVPAPDAADPINLAKAVVEKATSAAKMAEKRIYDWMVECGFRREMRKVIHDGARLGAGVIKAPFAEERKSMAVTRPENGAIAIQVSKKVVPSTKWIDLWNLFPDGSCGENIHDGEHIFERDYLSPKKLKSLKKQPGYLPEQIDKVLREGPEKCNEEGQNPSEPNKSRDKRFQVWYYYGTINRDDLAAARATGIDSKPDQEEIFAIITLVNDTVIRAVINPLDTGSFPYRVFNWSRRAGHWAGVGVSEQLFMPQRMANAGTRAMLNNGGITSGSQIIMDQLAITPANGKYVITPNKLWFKSPDAEITDLTKAFYSVEFNNHQAALMAIIEYAFRLAEESTNIPLITQGMSGPTSPDTFGATQLQNNNANQLLRSIAYAVDDNITEPAVKDFYEWLLLDPDVPDVEKGDFQINAHGSAALVERAISDQTIQQMGGMVLNPAFGADPKRWFGLYLKTKRLDPRDVQYGEGEAPPQASPPVQLAVAQANNQSRENIAKMEAQVRLAGDKSQQDRDLVFARVEASRDQQNAMSRREELVMKRELALLNYANQKQISLEDVKSQLAQTAMKLRTQKELAAGGGGPQLLNPPTEPPGRAPNGQAYQA